MDWIKLYLDQLVNEHSILFVCGEEVESHCVCPFLPLKSTRLYGLHLIHIYRSYSTALPPPTFFLGLLSFN